MNVKTITAPRGTYFFQIPGDSTFHIAIPGLETSCHIDVPEGSITTGLFTMLPIDTDNVCLKCLVNSEVVDCDLISEWDLSMYENMKKGNTVDLDNEDVENYGEYIDGDLSQKSIINLPKGFGFSVVGNRIHVFRTCNGQVARKSLCSVDYLRDTNPVTVPTAIDTDSICTSCLSIVANHW